MKWFRCKYTGVASCTLYFLLYVYSVFQRVFSPHTDAACSSAPVLPSVLDKTTAAGWDPGTVAQAVLKSVRGKSKDVVLAGLAPTLAIYLRALWPALFFKLMSSRARKELKPKNQWGPRPQVGQSSQKEEWAQPCEWNGPCKYLFQLFILKVHRFSSFFNEWTDKFKKICTVHFTVNLFCWPSVFKM